MRSVYYYKPTFERVVIVEFLKFGLIAVRNRKGEIFNVMNTDLKIVL